MNMASKKSVVWNHFTLVENNKKVQCTFCDAKLAYHSSTFGMHKHLEMKHKQEWEILQTDHRTAGAAKRMRQQSFEDSINTKTSYGDDHPRQKMLVDKLVKMIAKDMQPFKIVEDQGFRDFVNALDSRFSIPSRKKVSKELIPDAYEANRVVIQEEVENADYVAITTDLWTSNDTKSYIGITAHYLDGEWNLMSRVVSTKYLPERSTGENVGAELKRIFTKWNILNKIVAVVTDCASNMKAALESIGMEKKHVYCMGHLINLVVQRALDEVQNSDDEKDILVNIRKIVTYFHSSCLATERLNDLQRQQGREPLKLINDVSTRWNSTYFMLERYVELHNCIEGALTGAGKGALCITDDGLERAKLLTKCLNPFVRATREVSADKKPTLGKAIPILQEVFRLVRQLPDCDIKRALHTHLQKRFGHMQDTQLLTSASCMDPRFKNTVFERDTRLRIQRNLVEEMNNLHLSGDTTETETETEAGAEAGPSASDEGFWTEHDKHVEEIIKTKPVAVESIVEFQQYQQSSPIRRTEDPIPYWRAKTIQFPKLAQLSKKYMVIPATSVPAERLFSKAGELISVKRNRLKPHKVDQMLFLNKNLQLQ